MNFYTIINMSQSDRFDELLYDYYLLICRSWFDLGDGRSHADLFFPSGKQTILSLEMFRIQKQRDTSAFTTQEEYAKTPTYISYLPTASTTSRNHPRRRVCNETDQSLSSHSSTALLLWSSALSRSCRSIKLTDPITISHGRASHTYTTTHPGSKTEDVTYHTFQHFYRPQRMRARLRYAF